MRNKPSPAKRNKPSVTSQAERNKPSQAKPSQAKPSQAKRSKPSVASQRSKPCATSQARPSVTSQANPIPSNPSQAKPHQVERQIAVPGLDWVCQYDMYVVVGLGRCIVSLWPSSSVVHRPSSVVRRPSSVRRPSVVRPRPRRTDSFVCCCCCDWSSCVRVRGNKQTNERTNERTNDPQPIYHPLHIYSILCNTTVPLHQYSVPSKTS